MVQVYRGWCSSEFNRGVRIGVFKPNAELQFPESTAMLRNHEIASRAKPVRCFRGPVLVRVISARFKPVRFYFPFQLRNIRTKTSIEYEVNVVMRK